jgi:hypothetical protein
VVDLQDRVLLDDAEQERMPSAEKMFRRCPAIKVDSSANGIESGSVSKGSSPGG